MVNLVLGMSSLFKALTDAFEMQVFCLFWASFLHHSIGLSQTLIAHRAMHVASFSVNCGNIV